MAIIRLCEVAGCSERHFCRGYCKRHYDRWKRHGDPLVCLKPMVEQGLPRRWLEDHAGHSGDECLTWPFAKFPDGRAHMRAGKPARIMCELAHGPAPSPLHEAAHSCGRGHEACVNPRHLRWATKVENSADMIGHGTLIHGAAHYAAKLTTADVANIRSLEGQMLQREIAALYGVKITCINKILRGRAWRHV